MRQSHFLYQFLSLASRPYMQLDALLNLILERAIHTTASDAGGAIFVFDPYAGKELLISAAMRGELADSHRSLVDKWMKNSQGILSLVLRSGKPYNCHDNSSDRNYFPLLKNSQSSLCIPLLDGDKVIGALSVESSRKNAYADRHLMELGLLAGEGVRAINRLLLRNHAARHGIELNLVGASGKLIELEQQIRLAASDPKSPVLISGERGSGKELAAYAIHYYSERRDKPFLPINCAAFSEALYLDELFGHERYSFTGASTARSGRFKAAEGGTLFFDEIGDMTPSVQASLLRTLDKGEVFRIGRDIPEKADVRIIAATNKDIENLVREGEFREDLYDRLNVFRIHVPPLRERKEDIPLLAKYFLRKYCIETKRSLRFKGKSICELCGRSDEVGCVSPEVYQALQNYDYPGNVRELQNLIIRLSATVVDEVLQAKHLPEHFHKKMEADEQAEDLTLNTALRKHIEQVLRMTAGNRTKAAKILGIPRTTLSSMMKKLGLLS